MLMGGWLLLTNREELPLAGAAAASLVVGVAGAFASSAGSWRRRWQGGGRQIAGDRDASSPFASTVFVFKEKINRLEIAGCILIVSGNPGAAGGSLGQPYGTISVPAPCSVKMLEPHPNAGSCRRS